MNNEELQSRREFFKKAAKAALPVVAAVALASAPGTANAVEAMGCTGSCYGTCKYACGGHCSNNCSGGCKDRCHAVAK